jgi:hypothetical protein
MFTAESIKLLAKPARRQIRPQCDVGASHELRLPPADDNDAAPLLLPPGEDPDANIDPDDRGLRQNCGSLFHAPPEMPASWWIRMTLDPPDTVVTPEDVHLVFWHIRHRLAGQEATTGAFPPPADVQGARFSLPEGRDSGQEVSGDTAGDLIDSGTTVGQLHEAIEALGPGAWTTFVELWQEACGIQVPAKNEKSKPTGAPCPAADLPGKPDTPLLPLPANAPLLEEGLHKSLNEMPPRVVGFLLHQSKPPPVWRYCESLDERSQREQLEAEGCWTG